MEQTLQEASRSVYAIQRESIYVSTYDRVIVWLISLLATLPFGQVFLLRLGFVTLNGYEIVYLLLSLVLCVKIILSGRVCYPATLVTFCGIALLYIFYSSIRFGVSGSDSLRQLRFFAPFFVATLILAAGIRYSIGKYLKWMVIATLISSASALFIQYFAPGLLDRSLAASEDVYIITTQYGRMYWTNASLVFFAMLALFFRDRIKIHPIVMAAVLIVSLATLFATTCRTLLIGIAAFLIAAVYVSGNLRKAIKRVLIGMIIISTLITVGFGLAQADQRIADLIDLRMFGRGDVSPVYEQAMVEGRYDLYRAYAASIEEFFPLGQGLGRPYFTTRNEDPVFSTDISLMSFLIPFGIVGLGVLALFLWRLAVIIKAHSTANPETSKLFLVMLGVSLVMALNIDLFSRNNFVIYFTGLVMAMEKPTARSNSSSR